MPNRKTLTVSAIPERDVFVGAQFATGRYASVSEVIRAALRSFEREETASVKAAASRPRQQSRAG